MKTTEPIVVAFDGSDDATRALRWALDTATLTHERILVVIVAMDPAAVAPVLREYEQHFAASAAALARDITRHAHGVECTVVVHHGWTLPLLMEESRTARLMVVGSRGHGTVENYWLGSVSQHLAGHAHCPVAVIRAATDSGARQILVGVDGSAASIRALEYACARATLTEEEVVAVHAYQFPMLSSPGLAVLPENIDMTYLDAAERLVAELIAGVATDYPDVKVRATAVIGRPARVLATMSDRASLVVLGSRGRNAVLEIVLGSVAQETLHRSECPVVVVR